MRRRRLRLRYSSDEEEDEVVWASVIDDSVRRDDNATVVQPETSTASTSNRDYSNPNNPSEQVGESEVEFVDVSDDPTPTLPDSSIPTPYPVDTPVDTSGSGGGYDSPISEVLSRMGIRLKTEWWISCLPGLERSVPQFSYLDVAAKAKLCFEQFLFSDLNLCGGGVLPRNVESMNLVELAGPFVLQVDEIVTISCPLKGRYDNANAGLKRCLKLSMTDGVQRVFGMEYRPIKDLQVLAPAGLKIVVSSVQVRHGILMLVPEIIEVLGGMVEELEEARKRLVVEVNKPPRGKRTRTGVTPSLAIRASGAAWSLNNNDTGNHGDSSISENASHAQANGQGPQGIPLNATRTHIGPRTMNEPPPASINVEATVSRVEHMQIDTPSVHGGRSISDIHSTSSNIHMTASSTAGSCSGTTPISNNRGKNTFNQRISTVTSYVEEIHIENGHVRDTTPVSGSGSRTAGDADINNIFVDVETSYVLSTNTETPFTYLSNLSSKWAVLKDTMPFVQGRIKCFLTGVKKFEFRNQSTYELLCYVDDGSLICEILLHNNVVQKVIGHSSMEVSTALSSSVPTIVSAMKQNMKRFQLFLADFEGTMVVEMNRTSEYPVAIEMNQGCSISDARLLFERVRSSSTSCQSLRTPSRLNPPVVVLSP